MRRSGGGSHPDASGLRVCVSSALNKDVFTHRCISPASSSSAALMQSDCVMVSCRHTPTLELTKMLKSLQETELHSSLLFLAGSHSSHGSYLSGLMFLEMQFEIRTVIFYLNYWNSIWFLLFSEGQKKKTSNLSSC